MAFQPYTIPDDWIPADGYCTVSFTCPKSVEWRSILLGQFADLITERFWDENTGDVGEATREMQKLISTWDLRNC